MTEYGIFNDEGLIEGGFTTRGHAESVMAFKSYDEDDTGCHVAEICPDHEGQERENCDECNAEEDDE